MLTHEDMNSLQNTNIINVENSSSTIAYEKYPRLLEKHILLIEKNTDCIQRNIFLLDDLRLESKKAAGLKEANKFLNENAAKEKKYRSHLLECLEQVKTNYELRLDGLREINSLAQEKIDQLTDQRDNLMHELKRDNYRKQTNPNCSNAEDDPAVKRSKTNQ